ncbi:DUF7527 domain-containing protein [Halovenus sp. HT40]|uniref:DUF7527 domain-containing protein n=1 Tax=Halovenus sp. HT40 TaxID=3126691 RepID=UPI00300F3FAB
MSTRVVDQVNSWDDRSFSGGYRELQDLADSDFSGVVRASGAELYMTRGVVVGIARGDIEDFQSGGTVYEAPTDALPLLAVMQERSDEVRAKYYTEDTSISKVDKTLSDGGFTGFIELSENVLSGDYYLVYHAGTSMSVAYVGESGRLIEGDEAFETADDEVGIYEVRPVDIDPIDIPEPEDDEPAGTESAASAGADASTHSENPNETEPASSTSQDDSADGSAPPTETEPAEPAAAQESGGSVQQQAQSAGADAEAEPDAAAESEPTATSEQTDAEPRHSESKREASQSDTQETTEQGQQSTAESSPEPESEPRERRDQQAAAPETDRTRERAAQASGGAGQAGRQRNTEARGTPQSPQEPTRSQRRQETNGQSQQTSTSPAAEVETQAIPSLDPDQTAVPDVAEESSDPIPSPSGGSAAKSESSPPQNGGQKPQPEPAPEPTEPAPSPGEQRPPQSDPAPAEQRAAPPAEPDSPADPQPAEPAIDSEQLEELEEEIAEKDEEIDDLEAELQSVETERDDLEAELENVRDERDDLQAEVEELESDLRRLEEELGAATDADQRLTADEALAGTDIFVRYRSKGKATLEKAHGASTRKDEVNENLRLEKHTQFDANAVAVGGQSYDEFLESTLEYQFVRWVVRELLFEIRDTGHEKALSDLYDVLPRIDRAELSGVVEVTYTEDGQETQSQEAFDVVLRDRMGNPLLAANLNDTREATTESMMERLITSAERVGQSTDGFSGAFLVTESFFDPGALEIASDATQGGLLSRDKRKSFVNLSRKRGYHLCLVEARNENFHLAVPEL